MTLDRFKSWVKRGPLRSTYEGVLALLQPAVRVFFWLGYYAWPSLSRRALARSLPLGALKSVLDLKLSQETTFRFDDSELQYWFHSHNNFRMTERSIEIPIVRHFLDRNSHTNILEIGNVCNYNYGAFRHIPEMAARVVVDRYERSSGTLNIDIGAFQTKTRFDFVFSISTFEHMDSDRGRNRDYVPGSSDLTSIAADNVRHVLDRLMRESGVFILTAPIGYSEEWDETFYSQDLQRIPGVSYRSWGFRKVNELRWEQRDPSEGLTAKQVAPRFPEMNFVVVCEFRK